MGTDGRTLAAILPTNDCADIRECNSAYRSTGRRTNCAAPCGRSRDQLRSIFKRLLNRVQICSFFCLSIATSDVCSTSHRQPCLQGGTADSYFVGKFCWLHCFAACLWPTVFHCY